MDEAETIAACQQIYAETGQIYGQYKHQLGSHDYGFKILYGPPHRQPPVLFVGDQPGAVLQMRRPTSDSGGQPYASK